MGREITTTRPTAVEPWKVWYPKARAAWEQVTPESTNEEIKELYADVGPIPDRQLHERSDLGAIKGSDIASVENYFFNSLRLFKQSFGDSDHYLGVVVGDTYIPVFIVQRMPIDSERTAFVLASTSLQTFGKRLNAIYSFSLFHARRSILDLEGLRRAIVNTFKEDWKWLLLYPVFMVLLIINVFYWLNGVLDRPLANIRSRGWGWDRNGIGYSKSLSTSNSAEWQSFIKHADEELNRIFRQAARGGINATRGSNIAASSLPTSGMNPE